MSPEGEPPRVLAESDVPEATVEALETAGYEVLVGSERDASVGHAHMIRATADGFEAGSDPRADGGAMAS
jgi:gamma-glutamyltranspeptidase